MPIDSIFPKPPVFESEKDYYKRIGIDTEEKEIVKSLIVPKGNTCNGCLHCSTRLKQYVNMFGDPTRVDEEYYCDFFCETLFENGQEYGCGRSFEKCFQCKANFHENGEKDNSALWLILLALTIGDKDINKTISQMSKTDE